MRAARWLLPAALLLTALVYWPGLHGPFLLDDGPNLDPIAAWLKGDATWRHTLLSNGSGMLGRSLSMATLMFSAWMGGYVPFAFKLGNLVLHLLCGAVGWQVLRRLLARDPRMGAHADLTAAALVTLWLLHPLNVSTVLYAVQRMAQVSTLFTLGALWAYLASRDALLRGQARRAAIGLFVLFPLLLVAGLLGKENAAVAPALCLVLELAYFRGSTAGKRMLPSFYGLFLVLPAALVAGLLLLHPSRLLGGYVGRDFTLPQRLLSEGRALVDYIGALLLPRGPTMGVFTDDFAVSIGWLSPPTTFWALLALAAITTLAFTLRKRAPSVFAGWLFFLVAHAVESGFLPLELYFEHRNYLPAFGLWLAVAGLAEWLTRNLQTNTLSRRKLGLLAIGAYTLVLAFGTYARALVWADEGTLLAQEVRHHPNSLRANLSIAEFGINHGDTLIARGAIERLLQNPDARTRELGFINRVTVDCVSWGHGNPVDLQHAVALARPNVTLAEMYAFQNLASVGGQRGCGQVGPLDVADAIVAILSATSAQPDSHRPKWRMRLTAAQLYARTGAWDEALPQAKLAWQRNADPAAGGFLARVYAKNGKRADAERTYAEVVQRISPDDTNGARGLAELRRFLDSSAGNVEK